MTDEEVRAKAKELKIKSYHNKKIAKLVREIAILEGKETGTIEPKPVKASVDVSISEQHFKYIQNLGVKPEWLASLANRYGFTKLEYVDKFKSFRCYIGGRCVDWCSVNDLSALNQGQHLVEIINKTRELDKKKQVIKFPWRK